jgi:hypothetical protein
VADVVITGARRSLTNAVADPPGAILTAVVGEAET